MPISTTPISSLGLEPISSQRPAGESPRDKDTFAAVEAQIERLTDIHAESPINWSSVASLSERILSQEGKDLSVATWLTVACMHLQGPVGMATGIHIVKDLVQTYWDDMSPAATRMRGRRNQIQWLLDQLSEYLQGDFEPIPQQIHSDMLADWEALDQAWQAHDSDPPAFYGLRRILTALPVEITATESDATGNAPTAPASEQSAQPLAAERAVTAAPSVTARASTPISGADPETAIDTALESLQPLIDWCLNDHPTLPLLFRLNRICAWASLSALPPAAGIATKIPAPPDQVVTGLAQVAQGTEAQAIVHFAESRLISHRYWLDLNRISHAALSRMGASEAAATIAFDTAQLLARLPELATLTFNNGRPFADAETRIWLSSLTSAGSAQASADDDALGALTAAANADAAAGKLDAALDSLQAAAVQASSARDAFRLRVAQCDLLYRFDASSAMRSLLAPLIEELDVYQLSRWEPGLARQTLELAAAVEQRYGVDPDRPPTPMLARLAGLDCHAAWRLSQTPPTS